MLIIGAALLNSELWVVMVPLIFKSGIQGSVSFDAVGLELEKICESVKVCEVNSPTHGFNVVSNL